MLEDYEAESFLASEFYAEPFPFYHLKFMEVSPEYYHQGLGSEMLKKFTEKLKSGGVCGIVFDAIEGPAKGMYAKAGWVELTTHPGWFIFNPPKELEQNDLDEAIMRLQII